MSMDLSFVTSTHELYDRYRADWALQQNSYWGGTEYRLGRYLRAYAVDFATPGEMMNVYTQDDSGGIVGKQRARVEVAATSSEANSGDQFGAGSFYEEKLAATPVYNFTKLIASEYNAILFRNPPTRNTPDTDQINDFMDNVDGENNSINEFMSQVDIWSTIFGVCHVLCYMPSGGTTPVWRAYTPLDVTNWEYKYDIDGNLKLEEVVIKIEDTGSHQVYRYICEDEIVTIFVGTDDNYERPEIDGIEEVDDNVYMLTQPNELGYVPLVTIYQSTKVYNNVGTTVIQDVAQIQRSVYGDMAEIYSAITYGSHPTLLVDQRTESLNDGRVGAEPGSVIRVENSLTGEPNFTYEFKAPPLDAIKEIRDLVDSKIDKLSQISMLRSEELIRAARSGEQLEVYDDKLAAVIRKKATNLENSEAKLWEIWFDWLNQEWPEDMTVSYSRHYNRRALQTEIAEIDQLLAVVARFKEHFSDEDIELTENLRTCIRERLLQLSAATTTKNGL